MIDTPQPTTPMSLCQGGNDKLLTKALLCLVILMNMNVVGRSQIAASPTPSPTPWLPSILVQPGNAEIKETGVVVNLIEGSDYNNGSLTITDNSTVYGAPIAINDLIVMGIGVNFGDGFGNYTLNINENSAISDPAPDVSTAALAVASNNTTIGVFSLTNCGTVLSIGEGYTQTGMALS